MTLFGSLTAKRRSRSTCGTLLETIETIRTFWASACVCSTTLRSASGVVSPLALRKIAVPGTRWIGGFTPAISTYLIHLTGNKAVPGLWLPAAALCALIAILMTGENGWREYGELATLTDP